MERLQAIRNIPIVLVTVIVPVGAGFVESLARPGDNATGFVLFAYSLCGKWLELLKQIEMLPAFHRGDDASTVENAAGCVHASMLVWSWGGRLDGTPFAGLNGTTLAAVAVARLAYSRHLHAPGASAYVRARPNIPAAYHRRQPRDGRARRC